jgi:Lon protease-like protein
MNSSSIPVSLPILPLVNYVLLPSIVTTLTVCRSEGERLLKGSIPYIVCIPLHKTDSQKPDTMDLSQLFHYGCVAQVLHCDQTIPDQCTLKVKGICRSRIRDITSVDGGVTNEALLEHYPDTTPEDAMKPEEMVIFQSLCRAYVSKMRLIGVSAHVLEQLNLVLERCHVSHAANLLLCVTDTSLDDKLRALEILDVKVRLHEVNHAVSRYLQVYLFDMISLEFLFMHIPLQMINTSAANQKNDMAFDHIRRRFYILQEVHYVGIVSRRAHYL